MKSKMKLNARLFRVILAAILLLVIGLGAAGFIYANKVLKESAQQTQTLNSEAAASDENIAALEKLKKYLDSHTTEVDRVSQVVADSKQYRYQDEVIKDLTSYASESGIVVNSFNFTSLQTTSSTAPATVAAPAPPSGVTPTVITVTVNNPVDYNSILRFIRRIEQNVTKMQIANIDFSRSYVNGKSQLSVNSLNIEVYLRK